MLQRIITGFARLPPSTKNPDKNENLGINSRVIDKMRKYIEL